ncbi:DUF1893 domain-containing protein [Chloroflexota bacterium]
MYRQLYDEFLTSDDSLRVYEGGQLIFSSKGDRLSPLLEYIERFVPGTEQVVIFDNIMGNAAALLSVRADCREVYSPLGSQLAIKTLDTYHIKYYLANIVPFIQKPGREDMCPMERLSVDKGPEEFYEIMKNITNKPRTYIREQTSPV